MKGWLCLGPSAALTEEARHLVRVYRRWRARLQELSDRAFAEALRASSRRLRR